MVEIDSWTKAKAAALHPYRLPALPAVRTADIGAAAAQGRASCTLTAECECAQEYTILCIKGTGSG